jgi:RHS repeat-associated protein
MSISGHGRWQSESDYYFADGLGSTVMLARDSESSEAAAWSYDAFGEVRTESGTLSTDFLFTGEQFDVASDLYYLRARYYDASIGRFLTRDPMRSGNPYAYVDNSPLDYADPRGTCRIEVRAYSVFSYPSFMGTSAYHTYIYTYDPVDKSEVGYRGGPSNLGGIWDIITNLFGSRSSNNYVLAKHGAWDNDFPDYDSGNNDPSTEILDDQYSCDRWRHSFKETAIRINEARIPYGLLGPNSNSVVREMLENAGLEPSRPRVGCSYPGIVGGLYSLFAHPKCAVSAPGWSDDPWR